MSAVRLLILVALIGAAVLGSADGARPGAPPAGWSHPPFTLFPETPVPGDTLRCVVPAAVHPEPDRDTPSAAALDTDTTVIVRALEERDGVPWIGTEEGWIEAARLDRPADTPGAELEAGREGLAGGTVLPVDWEPSDLVPVPDGLKARGFGWREMRLREGALEAFGRLIEAAAADGVRIGIVSAYRSGDYQRRLYLRAVDRDPRQRESASPGRSEHRLGTTVDVAAEGVPPFREELADSPAGRWLAARAAEFGIVTTYSRERHGGRGVAHEPWHLRWVGEHADDPGGW